MPPPDDSYDCPSPEEELSPRLWRRRLVFTLPGESTAETYFGDSRGAGRSRQRLP
ncbi:hypothetical protein MTO96_038841, partial [Rhipicephalus appendiculatus]